MANDRDMASGRYVLILKEEERDPAVLHESLKRGLGIERPERIMGYVGLFFRCGNVYASRAVAEGMAGYRESRDFILDALTRFRKEDYGDISEVDIWENGENRWLFGIDHLYGRYGIYRDNRKKERYDSIISIRTMNGKTWVTHESEPDWYLLLTDEETEKLEDWSGRIREKAFAELEPVEEPAEDRQQIIPEENEKAECSLPLRYGALGIIVPSYTDEYGLTSHGTDTFRAGEMVYIRGKDYDGKSPGITVLGRNRFGRYEEDMVAVGQVSFGCCKRVIDAELLKFMNNPAEQAGWWGRSGEDRDEVRQFREKILKAQCMKPAFCSMDPTFSKAYAVACADRRVPEEILSLQRVYWRGKKKSERKAIKDRMALNMMADYPYKTEAELRYREELRAKRISEMNWLHHLDEMTDREITFMLEQLPEKDSLDRNRKARPDVPDRIRAEFIRDFG